MKVVKTKEVIFYVVYKRIFRWFGGLTKEFFGLSSLEFIPQGKKEGVEDLDVSLGELGSDNISELEKVTLAPFLPFNVYLFLTHSWDFIILEWGNFLFFSILLSAMVIRSLRMGLVMFNMVSIIWQYSFVILLYFIVWLVIKIWEVIVLRRLAWNRLAWKDYQSYRQSANNWHMAAVIWFVLLAIVAIAFVIAFLI